MQSCELKKNPFFSFEILCGGAHSILVGLASPPVRHASLNHRAVLDFYADFFGRSFPVTFTALTANRNPHTENVPKNSAKKARPIAFLFGSVFRSVFRSRFSGEPLLEAILILEIKKSAWNPSCNKFPLRY